MCSVLEGVAFATVLSGIRRALVDGERARQHGFLTMHAIQAAFLPAVKKQALLAQAVAIYHQEIAA